MEKKGLKSWLQVEMERLSQDNAEDGLWKRLEVTSQVLDLLVTPDFIDYADLTSKNKDFSYSFSNFGVKELQNGPFKRLRSHVTQCFAEKRSQHVAKVTLGDDGRTVVSDWCTAIENSQEFECEQACRHKTLI